MSQPLDRDINRARDGVQKVKRGVIPQEEGGEAGIGQLWRFHILHVQLADESTN
jgi:hypothetical protein